jgi:hypothetical protein
LQLLVREGMTRGDIALLRLGVKGRCGQSDCDVTERLAYSMTMLLGAST